MIVTVSGAPGSGKSSVSKLLAKRLGLKHYSVGDFMRTLAKKRGLSILEFSQNAEQNRSIDDELDSMQIELGKREDNFVIDSRLGFHFIPKSVKIFLDVQEGDAARRIFNHLRKEEKENTTPERTLENIQRRKASERLRYQKYYGLDCYDKKQYDLVLDTTPLSVEQVTNRIIQFLKNTA